jgi:hypothetical protein
MPELENPRWEAFAQCIANGLQNGQAISNGRAYQLAGYTAKDAGKSGGSAEVCAGKLLKKAQPILDRVRELQREQAKRFQRKADYSKDRVARRLDMASQLAEQQEKPADIVTSELAIAKLFNLIADNTDSSKIDYRAAQSMQDIGRKLLQSVGVASPSDAGIADAIKANDVFIDTLTNIKDRENGG